MSPTLPSLDAALQGREREVIDLALSASRGNVTQAALLIQTCRVSLYHRMRRLGIDYRSYRANGRSAP